MNEPMLSPAEVVIAEFGPTALARALDCDRSTVWRWSQPRPKGTGGRVPDWYHATLLRLAQQQGKRLTPAELLLGRPRQQQGARR